jgi:beta-lactamase class D
VAAVALNSGDLTETTQIPCRAGEGDSRDLSLTVARALSESNDDFFSQVLKRTGYEPVRAFLVTTRYTPGVPEAVASFADLARGEPLRVTVFEQNLFLQAFARRELPLRAEPCGLLERSLAVANRKGTWGQAGTGEISAEPPRHVSWFNGVARLKDGIHVITVAALTSRRDFSARERFLRYLSTPRR